MSNHIITWLVFLTLPIIFTWWGWKNVLKPYAWPTIKVVFKVVWKSMQIYWWGGLLVVFFCLPFTYRTWGFTVQHLILYVDQQFQPYAFEMERDWTHNLEYRYKWRERADLLPLDPNWKWTGPNSGWHWAPTWTVVIPPALIIWFIWFRRRKNAEDDVDDEPSVVTKRGVVIRDNRTELQKMLGVKPIDTPDELLTKVMASIGGHVELQAPPVQRTVPMLMAKDDDDPEADRRWLEEMGKKMAHDMLALPPPEDEDESTNVTLRAALKELGYKKREIDAVIDRCSEGPLEQRLKTSLRLLANAS